MEQCKISIGKKGRKKKNSAFKKKSMIAPISVPEEVHHYKKV
jgi:hypothetical protein